jgi:hypothetical protein
MDISGQGGPEAGTGGGRGDLLHEWGPAQVKAFRLLANRSATWAQWDGDPS